MKRKPANGEWRVTDAESLPTRKLTDSQTRNLPHEGLINIDKPAGMTSHDVVNRIRRVAGLRRVGHAGTLDPLATGVLLIFLGRMTRLVEYVIGQPKTYEATVRLGQNTNTYDAEGEIVAEYSPQHRLETVEHRDKLCHATPTQIINALTSFRGTIQQYAPIFSAIKKDGQPLYKRARRGEAVERPLREVTIYALELLDWDDPFIKLRVTCSAGTYIRSLAHDLGEVLGCGGHITALRRTAIGDFSVKQSVSLDILTSENIGDYLMAGDTAVHHLPRVDLSEQATIDLENGRRIPREPEHPNAALVRVYTAEGRFLGIATSQESAASKESATAESAEWQARKIFHAA